MYILYVEWKIIGIMKNVKKILCIVFLEGKYEVVKWFFFMGLF